MLFSKYIIPITILFVLVCVNKQGLNCALTLMVYSFKPHNVPNSFLKRTGMFLSLC